MMDRPVFSQRKLHKIVASYCGSLFAGNCMADDPT